MKSLLQQDRFLDQLYAILSANPKGLEEIDLLNILKKEQTPYFCEVNFRDSLTLFQTHFLLFHHLYLLRDKVSQKGVEDIAINCMRIQIMPIEKNKENLPTTPDGLKNYYLDLANLEDTKREDVEKMLSDFWTRYMKYDRRGEALKALGLEDPVDKATIKKRYHELALEKHPDKGGCEDDFQKLNNAADVLLN